MRIGCCSAVPLDMVCSARARRLDSIIMIVVRRDLRFVEIFNRFSGTSYVAVSGRTGMVRREADVICKDLAGTGFYINETHVEFMELVREIVGIIEYSNSKYPREC